MSSAPGLVATDTAEAPAKPVDAAVLRLIDGCSFTDPTGQSGDHGSQRGHKRLVIYHPGNVGQAMEHFESMTEGAFWQGIITNRTFGTVKEGELFAVNSQFGGKESYITLRHTCASAPNYPTIEVQKIRTACEYTQGVKFKDKPLPKNFRRVQFIEIRFTGKPD